MTGDLFSTCERDAAIDVVHAATAIYTAEPVVDELLDSLSWPRGRQRLGEPSCGDGVFLGKALIRLLGREPDITDDAITAVLEGWELHPVAVAQARARMTSILERHGRTRAVAAAVAMRVVRQGDFLTEGPRTPRFHHIVANPPYMRLVGVPSPLREEYLASLPAYACADLLHSFLARCASALLPGGEVAMVTADRWLFGLGAAKLRAAVGRHLAIASVRRLDASSVFYRPKERRAGTPPRIHPVSIVLRPRGEGTISLSEDPIYPDRLDCGNADAGRTLADIANVSLAPWLGTPGIFLVDSSIAAKLPADCLVPAIDTDDIKDGVLQTPRRFAIRTEPDVMPHPAVMEHIQSAIHRMAPRGRRKQVWLPPESWHKRRLDVPLLLVPRIARSLRPVRVPSQVLPVNHNLSIVAAGAWSLADIEALLTSEASKQWVQERAPRLEGGYYSLTTTLLRQLPVG